MKVYLIGGLSDRPARKTFLEDLASAFPSCQWQWVEALEPAFAIPPKYMRQFLHSLSKGSKEDTLVFKLALLHGRDANTLFSAYPDPILVPTSISTKDDLIAWLSATWNDHFNPSVWELSVRGAALVALLAKLMRNKSWNNDKHGHAWTKEVDLLGQAPVNRPSHPEVAKEAPGVLAASGNLLLTKGGNHGKTPKEWSIRLEHLPSVKSAFLGRDLGIVTSHGSLSSLEGYLGRGPTDIVVIDDAVVSERLLHICRDRK